jgi:hypothetical protein
VVGRHDGARTAMSDPLRMYLVVRRGAVEDLARAGELAGAAAVACVREPAFAEAVEAWRPRPGKVCLRARSDGQWRSVLEEPHALAGDAVAALPPRRRSERGPLLERLQAMSTDLGDAPQTAPPRPGALTYLLNPDAPMSSGKTLAQIAHAAVMGADSGRFEAWVRAGCPARVLAPTAGEFAAAAARDDLAACVADAGLTEVAPGTVTVVALPP